MLFFENTFLDWASSARDLLPWWALGIWIAAGHALASAFGVASWRGKAAWIVASATFGSLLPDRPILFLGGRMGDFSEQMCGLLALLAASCVALILAVARPSLHRLAPALAGLFLAVLSIGYHLVIMQGVDSAHRQAEERRLVTLLDAAPSAALCTQGYLRCGTHTPPPFNSAFTKDFADHTTYGLPRGADGTVSGSRGGGNAPETYVWAARRSNGETVWIYKSWAQETEASTLAMVLMMLLATAFWVPAPILVEILHRRAVARRKARTAAIRPPSTEQTPIQ